MLAREVGGKLSLWRLKSIGNGSVRLRVLEPCVTNRTGRMRPAARGIPAMVNASTASHPDHPANDDERIGNAGADMGKPLAVRPLKG